MSDYEPFAAHLDFVATAENLGKFDFVVPCTNFVTRESNDKLPRHQVELGGTYTPGTWLSRFHSDYYGGISPIVSLIGTKLWYFMPRTPHNASVIDRDQMTGKIDPIPPILEQMEGLQWAILDCPAGFIMDSFEYHGCLSLTESLHVGGPAWLSRNISNTICEINLMLDNKIAYVEGLRKPKEKKEANERLVEETKNYEDALENALRAADLIENEATKNLEKKGLFALIARINQVRQADVMSMGTDGN
jgi:hypothetical protein